MRHVLNASSPFTFFRPTASHAKMGNEWKPGEYKFHASSLFNLSFRSMDPPLISDKPSGFQNRNDPIVVESSQKKIDDQSLGQVNEVPTTRTTAERRLLRKIDVRLMPIIVVIYAMSFIDVSFWC